MIRIFMEAKQDFENLKNVLLNSMQNAGIHSMFDTDEKRVNQFIETFTKFKDQIDSPYKDVYWWINYYKTNDENGETFKLMRQVLNFVNDKIKNKEKFEKTFPSSIVRKFNKLRKENEYKLITDTKLKDNLYYIEWLENYFFVDNASEKEDVLEELGAFLRKYGEQSEEEQQLIEQGCQLFAEKDGWNVYRITNYEAAEKMGEGTGWCISGNYAGHEGKGRKHFKDYLRKYDLNCYYFFIGPNNEKYCALISTKTCNQNQIWDGTDGRDERAEDLEKLKRVNFPVELYVKACKEENPDYDEFKDANMINIVLKSLTDEDIIERFQQLYPYFLDARDVFLMSDIVNYKYNNNIPKEKLACLVAYRLDDIFRIWKNRGQGEHMITSILSRTNNNSFSEEELQSFVDGTYSLELLLDYAKVAVKQHNYDLEELIYDYGITCENIDATFDISVGDVADYFAYDKEALQLFLGNLSSADY